MRIISDFHDYYDVAQSTGQDQDLLYVRKPEKVNLKPGEYPFFGEFNPKTAQGMVIAE